MKRITLLQKTLFSVTLFLIAAGSAASAATFTVTNTNNSGAGSLRQAVLDSNAAAGSDTIVFDPSVFAKPQTITLASVITINNAAGDSVTINGAGAALLTVSGNNAVRIFVLGTDDDASISGMTLTAAVTGAIQIGSGTGSLTVTDCVVDGNTNTNGGAIENAGGSLTVTGCTFTNNTSLPGVNLRGGAAITSAFAGGVVTISDSTFTGNKTALSGGGGAIRNSGTMSINRCTFTGNSTTVDGGNSSGGAIYDLQGKLTLTDSVITGNSALRDGGGIFHTAGIADAYLIISNCAITNNTANSDNNTTGSGGGLIIDGTGPVTITSSTISGNTTMGTAGDGGGIRCDGVSGGLTLTNSTISGNSASRNGGGIIAFGGSTTVFTIESCTIVDNTATGIGGGLDRAGSTTPVNFHNTIVANNTDNGTAPDISGSVVSQGYNLIEDPTGATITGDTTGNIHFQDPVLGPLADNGGPTQTHVLLSGSPAIDAGDPSSFPATDQRGLDRPYDGDNNASALPDIGAYEAGPIMFVSAVSRKTHGPAGDFDLPLVLDPPGSGTVEPRAAGPTTLIFTFSDNAAAADGTLDANDFTISNATFSSASISGNTLILNLSAVVNASVVGVSLNGITSISGVNISGDNDLEVRALIGDVSGNGAVNGTDVGQTKLQSGAAATNANFREDVNLSGGINGSDVSQVKLSVGSAVP